MTALSNLARGLRSSPAWQKSYRSKRTAARKLAQKIPLIHTSAVLGPLLTPPYELHSDRKLPRTEEVERLIGWESSIYFYAGRIFPREAGGACFAFVVAREASRKGSVAPFDTGGFIHRHISTTLQDDQTTRKTFVQASCVPMGKWRRRFALFLAGYFADPAEYLQNKKPCTPDAEGVFQRNTDVRAWTWEIRFEEPQTMFEVAAWCTSSDVWEDLSTALARSSGADASRLADFYRRALVAGGTASYQTEMQRWVENHCLS